MCVHLAWNADIQTHRFSRRHLPRRPSLPKSPPEFLRHFRHPGTYRHISIFASVSVVYVTLFANFSLLLACCFVRVKCTVVWIKREVWVNVFKRRTARVAAAVTSRSSLFFPVMSTKAKQDGDPATIGNYRICFQVWMHCVLLHYSSYFFFAVNWRAIVKGANLVCCCWWAYDLRLL